MPILVPRTRVSLLGTRDPWAYAKKVKSLCGDNLLAYWPQGESGGSVADNYEGTAARDGTYHGQDLGHPGIGDGLTSAYYDGINDYLEIFTNSLRDNIDMDDICIFAWCKVNDLDVWTDSASRSVFKIWNSTADNRLELYKFSVANELMLRVSYNANNTIRRSGGHSDTDWMHLAARITGGSASLYKNGAQLGGDLNPDPWSGGNITSDSVCGAASPVPNSVWHGWLCHAGITCPAISEATLAQIAVRP